MPVEMTAALASQLGLKVAVETGTYKGNGTLKLRSVFSTVYTVELSEALHNEAAKKHSAVEGITFLLGPSSEMLPVILEGLSQPAMFWLDGHWTPGLPLGAESQCPVIDEIRAIDRSAIGAESCILIDDARLFLGAPPPPHRRADWPTFTELVDVLREKHPRTVTTLHDVIVAGPPEIQATLDDYWLGILARGEDPIQRLLKAESPSVGTAMKKLLKAVAFVFLPARAKLGYQRRHQNRIDERVSPRS